MPFNTEYEIRQYYEQEFSRRIMYMTRQQTRQYERQVFREIEQEIAALTRRNIERETEVINASRTNSMTVLQSRLADIATENRAIQGYQNWVTYNANGGMVNSESVNRSINQAIVNATRFPPEPIQYAYGTINGLTADELALRTTERNEQRKEQQMKVKNLKQELITNKAAEASLIRCGFELETQESNNITGDDRPINEDLVNDRILENASFYRRDYSFLRTWTTQERLDKFLNEDRRRFKDNDFLASLTEEELSDLEDASIEYARGNFNENEYQLSPQDCFDLNKLEVGLDSSVNGFEFRTRGPQTIKEFKEAAQEVFKVSHEIDEMCSFHIHLSVQGIKHSYSENFQLLLIEGLLKQANKVPESVMDRWIKGFDDYDDYGKYFQWEPDIDKYRAIAKHGNLNTWEFRCFGNVHNYKDAVKCLRIAINAMKYAYERQLNKEGPQVLTCHNVQDIAGSIAHGHSWDSAISDIVEREQQAA